MTVGDRFGGRRRSLGVVRSSGQDVGVNVLRPSSQLTLVEQLAEQGHALSGELQDEIEARARDQLRRVDDQLRTVERLGDDPEAQELREGIEARREEIEEILRVCEWVRKERATGRFLEERRRDFTALELFRSNAWQRRELRELRRRPGLTETLGARVCIVARPRERRSRRVARTCGSRGDPPEPPLDPGRRGAR